MKQSVRGVTPRRSSALLALGLCLALTGAACGSDGSSPKAAAGATTTTAAAASSSSDLSSSVADSTKPDAIDFKPFIPTEAATPKAGAKVRIVSFGQLSTLTGLMTTQVEELTKSIGWDVDVVDGDAKPALQASLLEQAVHDGVDGIIAVGIDVQKVAPNAVAAAKAAGIPIVCEQGCFDDKGNGVTVVSPDSGYAGEKLADWIADDSGGKANVLVLTFPEISSVTAQNAATTTQLKKVCPGCQLSSASVLLADITTPGVPFFVNLMNTKKVDYVVVGSDTQARLYANALSQMGRTDVKLLGSNGGKEFVAMLLAKQPQAAVTTANPLKFMSYEVVDALSRRLLGKDVANVKVPIVLVTAATAAGYDPDVPMLEPTLDYVAAFKKLWGVAGK